MRGDRRAFVVGGLIVGLATLARSDAILLGLPFAYVALRDMWPGGRGAIGFGAAVGCAALFVLVVAPWLYRQLEVFGSIAPSASNGRILWISEYSQLYSVGSPATPATLLADGVIPFVASRIGGLVSAAALFVALPLVVVLTPLALVGGWLRRADDRFKPFLIYAAALFGASGLLFAVHVPHGTFIHSAVALTAHTFVLVVLGIRAVVEWIAGHRPSWNAPRAASVFGWAALAVAVIGAAVQTTSTLDSWGAARTVQADLSAGLLAARPDDRVMSADAGAYRYLTGLPGVVTPNDDLATIESTARAYGIRWLVLERAAIVPALAPVLTGAIRPDWLSAPVAISGGSGPIASISGSSPGVPAGAVYAVCFAADDERCR